MERGKVVMEDRGSERIVLAGLCQYSRDALTDVESLINTKTFQLEINQILYNSIRAVIIDSGQVDLPSILAAANRLGYGNLTLKQESINYVKSLFQYPAKLENIRLHAQILSRLEIARRLRIVHRECFESLGKVTGNEKLSEILSLSEKPIFDEILKIGSDEDSRPENIAKDGSDYLNYLLENKVDCIGLSSPFRYWNEAVGGGIIRGGVTMFVARMKVGKAQPISSAVYTPTSACRMGDLKVGDLVCTPDGSTAKIINIFEQGVRPTFKITFNDGDVVRCDKDHLWKFTRKFDRKSIVGDLSCIRYNLTQWGVETPNYCKFDERPVRIDPYFLGAYLGGGQGINCIIVSTYKLRVVDKLVRRLPESYKYTLNESKTKKGPKYHLLITSDDGGFSNYEYFYALKDFELLCWSRQDQFIPTEFLINSRENRQLLLDGILDAADSEFIDNVAVLGVNSERLANDIKFLVESLGGTISIKNKRFGNKKITLEINLSPNQIRGIKEIEYDGDEECRCIVIDSPDNLYLTDNFVVTHNSTLAVQTAIHLAIKNKIPVLYLDTEMTRLTQQFVRMLSNISGIPYQDILKGRFDNSRDRVFEAKDTLENSRLFHKKIAGKPFPEVMSIVRRWVHQEVGLVNGKANDCLIIYDYFKLSNADDLQHMREDQAIGFQMMTLNDFCVNHEIAALALGQTNRDGITREDSGVVGLSDRLAQLCTSLTLLKRKTPEEIVEDGKENGNLKLIPLECRFGPGLDFGDYINMQLFGANAKIIEVGLRQQSSGDQEGGDDGGGIVF